MAWVRGRPCRRGSSRTPLRLGDAGCRNCACNSIRRRVRWATMELALVRQQSRRAARRTRLFRRAMQQELAEVFDSTLFFYRRASEDGDTVLVERVFRSGPWTAWRMWSLGAVRPFEVAPLRLQNKICLGLVRDNRNVRATGLRQILQKIGRRSC